MQESDDRSYIPQGEAHNQVPFPAAPDALAHEQTAQPSNDPAFPYADEPTAVPAEASAYAAFGAPAGAPMEEASAYPSFEAPTIAPKRSHRGLWITLASLFALLLLSLAAVSTYLYINRSTPAKTLDGFCKALQQGNYPQAYSAFSKKFQGALAEPRFANVLSQDKVVTCSYGATNEASNTMTTNLKLVHDSHGINDDIVTLVKDETNTWKINDVRKQA